MSDEMPQSLALPQIKRPVYTFTSPRDVLEFPGDPKEFKMVPLSSGEEKQAHDLAGAAPTGMSLTLALVKMSVTHVNGNALTWGDESRDAWWDKCGPKMRLFVMRSYRTVNEIGEEKMASFFEGPEAVYKVEMPA